MVAGVNPHDIMERVVDIKRIAGDDERAHSEEDKLHQDVLRAIADGAPNSSLLARAALETCDLDFARWCA